MNGDHRYGYISAEDEKEAIKHAQEEKDNLRKQVIEIIKEELPKVFEELLRDGRITIPSASIVGRCY